MKKIITVLISAILILTVGLASACTPIQGGNFKPPSTPFVSDSIEAGDNVKFNYLLESDRQLLTKVQVAEKVKNSVVALEMIIDEGGTLSEGSGSGVIVDVDLYDGNNKIDDDNEFYVITCHHCIEGATEVTVYVPDAEGDNFTDDDYNVDYAFSGVVVGSNPASTADLTLVGGDQGSDLAVLKIRVPDSIKSNIVEAKIMDTSLHSISVAEDILAIGNPGGLSPGSVRAGVVSYIGREGYLEETGMLEMVQMDAQTNHGDSGGAAFNMYGELIGINNAGNDDLNGVNFFIPLTTSKINQGVITIVKQLIGTKTTSNFGFVSGRWRKGFTVTTSGDTVVVKTVGSALYAKGLRKGDILVSIQHGIQIRSTSTVADYYNAMEELKESVQLGDTIKYTFRRGNAQDVITTTATQYTFGYADA